MSVRPLSVSQALRLAAAASRTLNPLRAESLGWPRPVVVTAEAVWCGRSRAAPPQVRSEPNLPVFGPIVMNVCGQFAFAGIHLEPMPDISLREGMRNTV